MAKSSRNIAIFQYFSSFGSDVDDVKIRCEKSKLFICEPLTASENNAEELPDPELLSRANELKRVLFSQDDDLIAEAVKRQKKGISFYGVIYAHQLRISIGTCIHDLELIAKGGEAQDIINSIQYLPL